MIFDFVVTLFSNHCDLKKIRVQLSITEEEYDQIKLCYLDRASIYDCEGLDNLRFRIEEAVRTEGDYLAIIEETDTNNLTFRISIPDEMVEHAIREEENSLLPQYSDFMIDVTGPIILKDYCEYPFAAANPGGIINLSSDVQKLIKERILEKLNITEEELIDFLSNRNDIEDYYSDEETKDDQFKIFLDCNTEDLTTILGFNIEKRVFEQKGIGFLKANCVSETWGILNNLGFETEEKDGYDPNDYSHVKLIFIQTI